MALALSALALITRLPGLVSTRMFNVDEAYIAAMGLTLGRGGELYVDVVDRKPPVLPWLYALSQWTLGSVDLRLLRLLVVMAVAATGVVVVILAARLGASARAAAIAGGLLVLGTAAFPPADGQAANFELFALLPSAAAVLLAVMARRRSLVIRLSLLFAAGLLVGLAGMIKQPFLVVLAPLAWEVLHEGYQVWTKRSATRVVANIAACGTAILVGVSAASLAIAAPFGWDGVWRWAWDDTGDYLDGQVGGLRILGVLLAVLLVFVTLHLPFFASLWVGRSRLRSIDPVVWFWLAGAAVAVVPGFRFIVHYFLLLVPPLALAAGLALTGATVRAQRWVLGGATVLAAGCVVAAALPFADVSRVGPELVAAVQERTGPDDRVVIWGALPELLWRSERLPGERFLSVGYLNGKWAGRQDVPIDPESMELYEGRWELFYEDIAAHHPVLVVDMTTSDLDDWGPYSALNYSFGELLERCYEPVGEVEGMALWELRDPSCIDEALSP